MIIRLLLQSSLIAFLLFPAFSNESFEDVYKSVRPLITQNIDQAIKRGLSARDIAVSNEDRKQIAKSYWMLGYLYETAGNLNVSVSYYEKAAEIYSTLEDFKSAALVSQQEGRVRVNHCTYTMAIDAYTRGLEAAKKSKSIKLEAELYYGKGVAEYSSALYGEAIHSLFQAQNIAFSNPDVGFENLIGKTYNSRGLIWKELALIEGNSGFLDSALNLYNVSLSFLHSTVDIHYALNNIGDIYMIQGNFDEAIKQLESAYKVGLKEESESLLTVNLNNLGIYWYKMKNYEVADSLFRRSVSGNLRDGDIEKYIRELHAPLIISNPTELLTSYEYLDSLTNYLDNSMVLLNRLSSTIYKIEADRATEAIAVSNTDAKRQKALLSAESRVAEMIKIGSAIGGSLLIGIIVWVISWYYRKKRILNASSSPIINKYTKN